MIVGSLKCYECDSRPLDPLHNIYLCAFVCARHLQTTTICVYTRSTFANNDINMFLICYSCLGRFNLLQQSQKSVTSTNKTQTLPAQLAKCNANQRTLAGAKKLPVRSHSGGARLKRAGSRSISRARAGHCDHSSNDQQLMFFFRVLRETPWKTSRLRLNESQTRTSRRKDHETTKHEARKRRKMETERTNVSKHMCK